MGIKEEKLKEYKKLWDLFESELKIQDLNLSQFSKKWELFHQNEESDYKKFYNKIKKQKRQLIALKSAPQSNTIVQLQTYIKFLKEDFVIEEMRSDESYEYWFD